MLQQVPVASHLFTWPSDSPRLLASRCTDCANHMFPVQAGCSKCGGASTATVELANRGTLWTWTVQSYPPKAPPYAGNVDPETFEPYGVGYVELDGKLLVESRLTVADPEQLVEGRLTSQGHQCAHAAGHDIPRMAPNQRQQQPLLVPGRQARDPPTDVFG